MANENDKAAPQTFEEWADSLNQMLQVIVTESENVRFLASAGTSVTPTPLEADIRNSASVVAQYGIKLAAAIRTRPAPTIDEDSAVAVLQRIVNRNWSCPCKGHGSYEAALLCYVTSELQSRSTRPANGGAS